MTAPRPALLFDQVAFRQPVGLAASESTCVTTGLIAVLLAKISILVKVSVLVWFETASQALPVVAVIETVVKARGNLVTVRTGAVFSEAYIR